jgi:hypothetical protein
MIDNSVIKMTIIDLTYLLRKLPRPLATSKKNATEATIVYFVKKVEIIKRGHSLISVTP